MGGTPRLDRFVASLVTWPGKLGLWLASSSLSIFPCAVSLVLPSLFLETTFSISIAPCLFFPLVNPFSLCSISLLGPSQTNFSTYIPRCPPVPFNWRTESHIIVPLMPGPTIATTVFSPYFLASIRIVFMESHLA